MRGSFVSRETPLDGGREPDLTWWRNGGIKTLSRTSEVSHCLAPTICELLGGGDGAQNAGAAFGVANFLLEEGLDDSAMTVFETILAGGQSAAFGYIAAEAEMARR